MKIIYRLSLLLVILVWACEKESEPKYMPKEVDEQLAFRLRPTATFVADTNTVQLGRPVSFSSTSVNTPESWFWDFGDGEVSKEENPKHFYKQEGEYTVKLTVKNLHGETSYSQILDLNIIDDPSIGFVEDIDGNIYFTKQIGNQTWMLEHLRSTHFNDGTAIQRVDVKLNWFSASEAYCWYDNNEYNYKHGALYNKKVVNTGKIAPEGWHVPSKAEWETLVNFLGGNAAAADYLINLEFPIETGYRDENGNFIFFENYGLCWTTTTYGYNTHCVGIVTSNRDLVFVNTNNKRGLGIRCIKD